MNFECSGKVEKHYIRPSPSIIYTLIATISFTTANKTFNLQQGAITMLHNKQYFFKLLKL